MHVLLALLLAPQALAQDPWGVAMPGELPTEPDADFVCDWSFNGATGTGYHTYSEIYPSSGTVALQPGVMALWLDDGSTAHELWLRYPTAATNGTRWQGTVTSANTSLICAVIIGDDGSFVDYPWCVGTLYGTQVQSMAVACDER